MNTDVPSPTSVFLLLLTIYCKVQLSVGYYLLIQASFNSFYLLMASFLISSPIIIHEYSLDDIQSPLLLSKRKMISCSSQRSYQQSKLLSPKTELTAVSKSPFINIIIRQQQMNETDKKIKDQTSQNIKDDVFPFHHMFRFADKQDLVMIIFGVLCSLASGACTPVSFYLLIQFDATFLIKDGTQMISSGYHNMMNLVYLGIAAFMFNWLSTTIWIVTGQRQSSKCKKNYYSSLLSQDAEFFDCSEHSFVNSKFTIDTDHFQSALGEKIGLCIQFFGNFFCALALSLWEGWLLALFMFIAIILVLLAAMATTTSLKNKEARFMELYSKAGSRAEEAISAIRTVKQFNAESYELSIFGNLLQGTADEKFIAIIKIAVSYGFLNSLIYVIYSFGFWFGGNCMAGTNVCLTNLTGVSYINQNVHTITFMLLLCLVQFTLLTPALKQVAFGRQAAQRIFKVIDRVPKIQVEKGGIRLDKFEGRVQLRNVSFAYPKEKSKKILDGVSLVFDLRSSAVVGQSGCGKSTIAQLLMRLYDPDEGEVLIDGHNIREFDLSWLRSRIGYVGQEPVLFAATIRENLLYANPVATEEEMVDALRQSQVYDFVFGQLQKGLETQVGVGGSQISGGQKQRIAIARALVKQPQLLILDEATSALDRSNQRAIQQTLNKIAERLTTITIAHRTSTIKECNTVFVLKEGKIQEQGKYQQLHYFKAKIEAKLQRLFNSNTLAVPQGNYQPQSFDSSQNLVRDDISANNHLEQIGNNQQRKILANTALLTKYQQSMFCRIFSFNQSKKFAYLVSVIATIGIGLIYPIFAIFVSQVFISILHFKKGESTLDDIYFGCQKFLYVALVSFVLFIIQSLCGEFVGDQIASNIRLETYGKIIKMPIPWFNRKDNTCGALSSRLSVQCEKIKDLITTYIFIIIRCVTIIISGVVIMFVYQWKLTLVIFGFMVVLVSSALAKSYFKTKLAKQIDFVSKKTSGVIEESLMNIRTVSSFNMQKELVKKYQQELKGPSESLIRISIVTGFMTGLGYVIVIMVFGILVYVSLLMIVYDRASFNDLLTTIFEFYFMALALSRNLNFLPDAQGTKISIANILNLLDAEDQDQIQEREGSKRLTEGFKGDIEFRDVSFRYEDRQQSVLTNLILTIKEGEKAALVGASGCGKSTLVQLLLRFYEPTAGGIYVGGIALRDFDLAYLRSQFGVVAQEPVVFNTSFRQNIRYNTPATEQQIRDAAIQANAMVFIEQAEAETNLVENIGEKGTMRDQQAKGGNEGKQKEENVRELGESIEKLNTQELNREEKAKQGLERNVGVRGFHISGGQKQRVAIARVLIRNPKVLLLDEATSALDTENEREVQCALDKAMAGRTAVTVAHRIETIKNSHVIHVFAKGRLEESGTYEQLIKLKGTFWNIANGNKV